MFLEIDLKPSVNNKGQVLDGYALVKSFKSRYYPDPKSQAFKVSKTERHLSKLMKLPRLRNRTVFNDACARDVIC